MKAFTTTLHRPSPWSLVGRGCAVAALALMVTGLCVAIAPAASSAATNYKLPWEAGGWNVTQGQHEGRAWDFQPPGSGSHNNEVLAVAAGTAKIVCTDAIGQATVSLTVGSDVFRYLHLKTADVASAGITTAGVPVQQGQVLGRLYPTINWNGACGKGSGSHLHLVMPNLPITIDGVTFSSSGPNGVTRIISTNHKPSTTDIDGDGTPDSQDDCPTVAGPPSTRGCPVRPNLLSNASFERGVFEPWQHMANTNYIAYQDAAVAKEGSWYGATSALVAGASVYQDVDTDPLPGESYGFSVWLRARVPGTTVAGNIRLYALGGTVENQGTEFTVGDQWTLVTAPLDVGLAGHTAMRAQIYLSTLHTDLAFDGGTLSAGSARAASGLPPSAPRSISSQGRNRSITVTWAAPVAPGSSPITSYTASVYEGTTARGTVTVAATARAATLTGLANGTAYTVRVTATSAAGTGPAATAPGTTVPVPYSSTSAFVAQTFRDLAGRAPTTAESSTWMGQIDRHTKSPADLVAALRRASDATSVVDPVARLYRAYFGRIPDAGGLTYWVGQRRAGVSLTKVSDGFARSAEFRDEYGPLTNRQFVERVYRNILDRPGEVAGVTYWTGQLDQGRKTRGGVMIGFSESAEYKQAQAAEVDVAVVFISLLGRAPTAQEHTQWVNALERTTSPATLTDLAAAVLRDPGWG